MIGDVSTVMGADRLSPVAELPGFCLTGRHLRQFYGYLKEETPKTLASYALTAESSVGRNEVVCKST